MDDDASIEALISPFVDCYNGHNKTGETLEEVVFNIEDDFENIGKFVQYYQSTYFKRKKPFTGFQMRKLFRMILECCDNNLLSHLLTHYNKELIYLLRRILEERFHFQDGLHILNQLLFKYDQLQESDGPHYANENFELRNQDLAGKLEVFFKTSGIKELTKSIADMNEGDPGYKPSESVLAVRLYRRLCDISNPEHSRKTHDNPIYFSSTEME